MNVVTLSKDNIKENGTKNNGKNGKRKKNKIGKKQKKDKTWAIADTTNHSCPHAHISINIPRNLYDEIMKMYIYGLQQDIEISIYAKVIDGYLTEIHVPLQENGKVDVEIQESVPLTYNCIIHSHPGEIAEFSQQDWLTLMVNRDCCLLINQGKFTDGKYRLTMPCGSVLYSSVNVVTENDGTEQKIRKRKYVMHNFQNFGTLYDGNGSIDEDELDYCRQIGLL